MKLINTVNKIIKARGVIKRAFEDDPNFFNCYKDNIAILLYDKIGGVFQDPNIRNNIAKEILHLIFWK